MATRASRMWLTTMHVGASTPTCSCRPNPGLREGLAARRHDSGGSSTAAEADSSGRDRLLLVQLAFGCAQRTGQRALRLGTRLDLEPQLLNLPSLNGKGLQRSRECDSTARYRRRGRHLRWMHRTCRPPLRG